MEYRRVDPGGGDFAQGGHDSDHPSHTGFAYSRPSVAVVLISAEIIAGAVTLYGVCFIVIKLVQAASYAYSCDCRKTITLGGKARKSQPIPVSQSPSTIQLEVKSIQVPIKSYPKNKIKQFTIGEVMRITDSLRIKLGQGGFGVVYYGNLSSGQEVAVKRLSSPSSQGTIEFINEVELTSRICHENLVSLIGYCCDMNERILIYEYMPRGSLHDHLYGREAGSEPLGWKQRLKIAIGAAKGLDYLHTGCKPAIIHRDVKSGNILLDHTFQAKIADLGISKIMQENLDSSNGIKGTVGYLDPEYFASQRANEKTDVYGFGIVLMELICGRQAIVPTLEDPSIVQNIVDWAKPYAKCNSVDEIIDKSLQGKFNKEAMEQVLKISLMSVERTSPYRPTMREILQSLNHALEMEVEDENKREGVYKPQSKMISCFQSSHRFRWFFSN